jgi:NitT/TauT family transport system substrate-binding protein
LLLALIIGFSVNGCRDSQDRENLKSITINQWGQALIYLPLYVAQQEGFFEQEGLRVTITNGGGDDLTWAAVTSGNAQFGVADPTMVALQARQGGVPGRVIGNIVGKVAFWAVTLDSTRRPITGPTDFRGDVVAAFRFPNTANALALRTFQQGGLQVGRDVRMIEVDYPSVLAQLQRGDATLAMVLEPAASTAESAGGKVVYSYPAVWGDFAFTGLTATDRYLSENPETAQKVVTALQRALDLIHSDFERAVSNGERAFPELEPAVVRRAVRRMIDEGTIPKSITPSPEGWSRALDVAVRVGRLADTTGTGAILDPSYGTQAQMARPR